MVFYVFKSTNQNFETLIMFVIYDMQVNYQSISSLLEMRKGFHIVVKFSNINTHSSLDHQTLKICFMAGRHILKASKKFSFITSRGSNIPFLVTIICLGCSSTGNERIRAATSSAVFHFASWMKKIKFSAKKRDLCL